jgi:hypothetical protein
MAMPNLRRRSGLGFAGPLGSRREARQPSRVQASSLEVQILPLRPGQESDVAVFSSLRRRAIRFCSVRRLIPSISAARLRFPPT